MTTDAKPHPPELAYDADTGEIDCRGAAVAHMYEADDFPCLDDADRGRVQRQLVATGAKLVRAYNAHAELFAVAEAVVALIGRDGELNWRTAELGPIQLRRLAAEAVKKATGR